MTSDWLTNLPRSNRTRTQKPDIAQIAALWSSMSDKQRSRKLERMSDVDKRLLKLALRETQRLTPQATR